MNNIVKTSGGAISADLASKLLRGIGESRSQTIIAGGDPLLRLLRHGEWVYGQEDTPTEEGSLWAVNPLSIEHGYSCWSNYEEKGRKNDLLGEVMAPIYEAKPHKPEPINGFHYSEQRLFRLKCISGEDQGQEVLYKTSSVGGMRAVDALLGDMQAQLETNPAFPCPVVELNVDSYQHTKYGKLFVPMLDLRGWADMNGNLSDQGELLPDPGQLPPSITGQTTKAAPVAEPEPTQRRRRGTISNANPTAAAAPTRSAEAVAERMHPEPAQDSDPAPQRTGMPRRRPGQR